MHRGKVEIIKIIQENSDTKTFHLKLLNGKMEFKPGQFAVLQIPAELGGGPKYSRAYSIASSPTEEIVELTMNIVGMFTKQMNTLNVGAVLNMQGPFGHFHLNEEKHHDIVTISGGTGITPFRSMWRYITAKKLPIKITPLVSFKHLKDYVYTKELGEMEKHGKAFVTLTREPENTQWKGSRGRINAEFIKKHVGKLDRKTFFICGSNSLNDSMSQTLQEMDVAKENIIMEKWGEF